MYSVSTPCQVTRPYWKSQPYQELVDHIQMCAGRAHYPNMQLYNNFFKRIDIHTILDHLLYFAILLIIKSSYKPLVDYRQSFLQFAQCHKQGVTTHISIFCSISPIIISCHITLHHMIITSHNITSNFTNEVHYLY